MKSRIIGERIGGESQRKERQKVAGKREVEKDKGKRREKGKVIKSRGKKE